MTPSKDPAEPRSCLISVVVPVYKSAETLRELNDRLHAALAGISPDYEIIYVDDCSPGNEWEILGEFVRTGKGHVSALQLMSNRGQQRALLAGMARCRGTYIATIDADLQQNPADLPLLYATLISTNADVAVGKFVRKQHGWMRRLGTWAVRQYYRRNFGVESDLELTSFRLFRSKTVEAMLRLRHQNPVIGYLALLVTRKLVNVEVAHVARPVGASSYRFSALASYFSVMVFDYSDWPLRLASIMGLLCSLLSFSLGGVYLIRYLLGGIGVSGFTTLVLLITFLFGLVFMTLGVIGAYLVRVLRQSNQPESYAVRDWIQP